MNEIPPTSVLNAPPPIPELSFHMSEALPPAVVVSVGSHACQTAAFDSRFNAWEYLQYVDLCLSWDRYFITSFSRHIQPSLFPSPRQHKSGPGPDGRPTEQYYKIKSNRPATAALPSGSRLSSR